MAKVSHLNHRSVCPYVSVPMSLSLVSLSLVSLSLVSLSLVSLSLVSQRRATRAPLCTKTLGSSTIQGVVQSLPLSPLTTL
jgi:hypothetical protein